MFKLLQKIKRDHRIPTHTKKVLIKNRHVKDFCEESRVYALLPPEIGIHYDVATWFENDIFLIKVRAIGLYDTFMEYNIARLKQLSEADKADRPEDN